MCDVENKYSNVNSTTYKDIGSLPVFQTDVFSTQNESLSQIEVSSEEIHENVKL